MKGLIISNDVETKIVERHQVTRREVEQCFENCEGEHLIDDREKNRTDPPTKWFLACTNKGRLLKVVFVFQDGKIFLKTAYDANSDEIRIYKKYAFE